VREHAVDVALVDIDMPGRDGLAATAEVVSSDLPCRCLIVTTFGRPGYLSRGMEAGAAGFIVKDTPPEALAEAIRKVHAGLRVIDPELAQESVLLGPNPLAEREKEVLLAAATGADAREIATRLSLGEGTVRNYLSSAIAKTHARNRTEAAPPAHATAPAPAPAPAQRRLRRPPRYGPGQGGWAARSSRERTGPDRRAQRRGSADARGGRAGRR